MELLNGKFEVTFEDNASLRGGWDGAKQAEKYRIKFNETGRHCFIVIYGGSTANIDEKDALYYLLSDAVDYMGAKDYKGIENYLINDLGYDEFVEDAYGRLKKNPELKRVGESLRAQYNKACTLVGGADKLIDELEAFRNEYDY